MTNKEGKMKRITFVLTLLLALSLSLLLVSCASSSGDSKSVSFSNIKNVPVNGDYTLYEISPAADGRYNIYGYIKIPRSIKMKHLVVNVMKTGNEQPYKDTVKMVKEKVQKGSRMFDGLNAILLYIALPEIKMYDGSRHLELDTKTLLEEGEFGHIDAQVCSLIDDARSFLMEKKNKNLPEKVDMYGYSGEGDFIVRFALLHPQYLHAVCAGGISWSPSVALATLNGEPLNYPLGLGNIEKYSDDFNLEQWKNIHFFVDMGILDDRGSYNKNHLKQMKWSKNLSFPEVYEVFCNAFINLTDNAEMVLYEKMGHKYDEKDYINFLQKNDGEDFVPIKTQTASKIFTSPNVAPVK